MQVTLKALCVLVCFIALVSADCPHQRSDLTRWSSWSGKPSGAMQNVTIPSGTKILLDESTPLMHFLHIFGELIFDEKALTLDAHFIYVREGGHLWIGTQDCTYNSKSTITLHGTKNFNLNPNGFGSKVLGVWADGLLDMWGTVRGPTWTNLDGNVYYGATTITVADDVQWQVGDQIVIASTDLEYDDDTKQSEKRTITAVSGRTLTLDSPLQFGHWGSVWQGNANDKIDMRAEVGMLTRNIVIRGTMDAEDGWGGHVMVMESGHGRFYGVEVTNMGQKGLKARYPIHYHVAGDQTESRVSHCSLHDLFQRCLTVHGTSNLLVQNNVAFNTLGHCFFIEDSDETYNRFYFNLAITAKTLDVLLAADTRPAMFWVTNPSNDFIGNVAVGGHFGFWFAMPTHPLGLAASEPKYEWWPRHSKLGLFIRNKAHSIIDSGVFFDDGQINDQGQTELSSYIPRDVDMILNNYVDDPSTLSLSTLQNILEQVTPSNAVVVEFTAYKCRGHGIWGRSDNLIIHNARVADNTVGINCPGVNVIQGALVVGETDNVGNPHFDYEEGRSRFIPYTCCLDQGIFGIQSYDAGGGVIWNDITFYNFNDFNFVTSDVFRPSGAITALDGPNVLSPSNKFFNMKFNNVDNRVYYQQSIFLADQNAMKGIALVDSDGSITGDCGAVVVGLGAQLRLPGCVEKPEWNAAICPSNQIPLRNFAVRDANDPQLLVTGNIPAVRAQIGGKIVRLHDHASVTVDPRQKESYNYPNGTTEITAAIEHMSNLRMYYDHLMMFGPDGSKTPSKITITLPYIQGGEWVRIAIPFPTGTTFSVKAWYDEVELKSVSTKDELGPLTYFYDGATKLLWLHLFARDNQWGWFHGLSIPGNYYQYQIAATCPGSCSVAGINPDTISAITAVPDDSKRVNWCEKSGPLPLNGRMVWSNTGKEAHTIFDDDWRNSWAPSEELKYTVATDQHYDGSSSILLANFPAYSGMYVSRPAWQSSFDPVGAGYTHFEFKVRVGPKDADRTYAVSMGIRLGNDTYTSFPGVELSSAEYSNEQPTTDDRWTVVRVPLSELGLQSGMNIAGFYLAHQTGVKLLEGYFDGIQFAAYTTRVEAIPGYNVHINYDVPSSPFDGGNGPGSSPISAGGNNPSAVSSSSFNQVGMMFSFFGLLVACFKVIELA